MKGKGHAGRCLRLSERTRGARPARTAHVQVGAMLHMHRLGTAMVAQHVRNGSELRPFARRSYYDYG